MMYLGIAQVAEALKNLETMHTFFGITFLVMKANSIPVGRTVEFALIAKDREFLEKYYKPYPQSEFYFRVSRTSAAESQHWLSPKYPGGGLQKIRTQDPLKKAFIHSKKSDQWGWQTNYVDVLRSALYESRRVPAFHLAVWLYRDREWAPETSGEDILWTFLDEFQITQDEMDSLLDTSVPTDISFNEYQVTWRDLYTIITELPPDAKKESGGTLSYLRLEGIGAVPLLEFEPAKRINLITGDNGLGKTFILESAWWALTGLWTGLPAYPFSRRASITYQLTGDYSKSKKTTLSYDWQRQTWPQRPEHETIPGLLIYARTDNSFAVWDPAKLQQVDSQENAPEAVVFSPDEVWDGKKYFYGGRSRFISNGLILDWVSWQNNQGSLQFETLKRVLARLSPTETGQLVPGTSARLPNDSRAIPTLRLAYGDVPIVHAASGMRRIVSLAYMIVWAWFEHQTQSTLVHVDPQKQMIVIIDELEAHLHPRWQRLILPALLEIQQDLEADLNLQFFITTHSPLVTASVEPSFDSSRDKFYRLDLVSSKTLLPEVRLDEIPFIRHGTADAWLTSDVFELEQSRSLQAEEAIENAKALQLQENPDTEKVRRIHNDLLRYLAQDDIFWPRWIWFAEQNGVSS